MNKEEKIKILNKLYPISSFFDGEDLSSNVPCIFHNDRKPSAKVYLNDNVLWCFTCNRFYYISNFISYYQLDIDKLFEQLYKIYDTDDITNVKCNHNKKKSFKVIDRNNKSFIEYATKYFLGEDNDN